MRTRIALTEDQYDQLARSLDGDVETAAVIAAAFVSDPSFGELDFEFVRVREWNADEPDAEVDGDIARADTGSPIADATLVVRTIQWVPEDAYLLRSARGLTISSTGWVPTFRAAAAAQLVPVFVHTHPSGEPAFSRADDDVDAALATAARDFGARAYASIIFAGRSGAPSVIARLCVFGNDSDVDDDHVRERQVDEEPSTFDAPIELEVVDAIRVAGSSVRLLLRPAKELVGQAETQLPEAEAFDRQVRMLGVEGQRTLRAVRVAVIGVGGTGSAAAVQLARLGVGEICLVDDDVVTAPTPTRGHGMSVGDIGTPKVSVLGRHLRDIGLGTRIVEVDATLHSSNALRAISHADFIFSCVDGHGARLILNRFAYAHFVPVIDLAVLVSSHSGSNVEIDERVTWIAPGTACLLCRGRLDAALAYAENLDPEARRRLAGEGYVAAAETPQPAVVTLTTLVAALAATEFLLRLVGIGTNEATELLLRPHVGDLRRNRIPQRPGCFCNDSNYLGRGRRSPYLDLMWAVPPFEDAR